MLQRLSAQALLLLALSISNSFSHFSASLNSGVSGTGCVAVVEPDDEPMLARELNFLEALETFAGHKISGALECLQP